MTSRTRFREDFFYRQLTNGILILIVSFVVFFSMRKWVESSLVLHILLEFPLLVVYGVISGKLIEKNVTPLFSWVNQGGIFGLLTVTFILAFWMIPRWLDASINDSNIAYCKYLSLFLAGLILSLSWGQTHSITRALVKIEFITMLFRIGWIYLISPTRLCNNYLLNEQVWLGQLFLVIGVALIIYWLIPIFFADVKQTPIDMLNRKPN